MWQPYLKVIAKKAAQAVHVLDQMVRQLPDGIYLRSLKQVGPKITLVGYAQSNARVSTLMRNIESSPWLQQPELVEIKSIPSPTNKDLRVNEFTLNVQLKQLAPLEEPKIVPGTGARTPAAPPVAPPAAAPTAPAKAKTAKDI